MNYLNEQPQVARAQAGDALAHDSAHKHVSGGARYVDDTDAARLHIAVGKSAIAHGEIVRMDLSAVRAAPGVVDVVTAADVPGAIDIGAVFGGDPLLASEAVEYVGQPLFAVAARDLIAARRAVALAKIEYREHPPVLALRDAIAREFYVRPPHRMTRGDASNALARAAHKCSGEVCIGGQEHFYLEGQAATARVDEDGGVIVHSSNQNPSETQKLVAQVLRLPMSQVVVITRRMGGGFGGKETHASAWACLAALIAVRTGMLSECKLPRRDDFIATGKRHNFINQYEVGFDSHGAIDAVRYTLAAQCGNSPDLSDAIVDRAMFHCDNCYYLPNADIVGLRCKTHTVSNTAFRGFGGPQGMLAAETVIDEIAFALDKDPLEVRKANLYADAPRNVTPYHQTVDGFNVADLIAQLEQDAGYWQRRDSIRQFNAANPIIKKGIALTPVKFGISFTATHLNQAGALVHLYTDGGILLNHGGTEMGQGLFIKVAQVVAREFGVRAERVQVCATRTDKVPNTAPTAASAGADLNGMAAKRAAREIKLRLVAHLADKHGVPAAQINFADECVQVGDVKLSLAQVAQSAHLARVSLSAFGFYRTPDIHYDRERARGAPFYYYATGAAVSEVAIDSLTGEYKLLRADILHDVGNSINPAVDIGQIEGGYIQGVGWLTCEELKWDAHGRLLSDSPATYKIPAIGDAPAVFNTRMLSNAPNTARTVFRSKAVGEPPLMLAISVWCAIRDAIAACADGKVFPVLHAPATPEEILRCIDSLTQTSSCAAKNTVVRGKK